MSIQSEVGVVLVEVAGGSKGFRLAGSSAVLIRTSKFLFGIILNGAALQAE
jgi:hypothetical protein